jgi:redox-sensitive bicupin YhaK (pirin superfamily)
MLPRGCTTHPDRCVDRRPTGEEDDMSGPVTRTDDEPVAVSDEPSAPCVELTESREETVGRIRVRRALPRRGRRTVGAWCFADHMGPADVTERSGLDIGAHPHIVLQTVTWLLDGQALHRDSLGSEQVIAPGQLNLMTAGHGVSHSEEATGHYRGELEGIQLWIAQPEGTREGDPAFEHHEELPQVQLDRGVATVLVGELAGTTSPARHDTPLVGADLFLVDGTTAVPVHPDWEYALVVLRGGVGLHDQAVEPGRLAYLGEGRDEIVLEAAGPTRVVLLGGEPLEDRLVMWWNFVGRDREEISTAYASWQEQDDRFGRVRSALPRIPAPPPYWQQTRPT